MGSSLASRSRFLAEGVLLFAAYFFTAKFGLKLGAVHDFVTLIWPPTGIALAAFLIWGRRLWPAVALAAFLVSWSIDGSIPLALGIAVGNTLEALVGVSLLQWFGFRRSLERLRDVFALIILAGFTSTLISATIGVTALVFSGVVDSHNLRDIHSTWVSWWLGDITGALIIAPFLLVWSTRIEPRKIPTRRKIEILALSALVITSGLIIFGDIGNFKDSIFLHPYFIFPVLMFIALRLEQKGTVTAIFMIAIIITVLTAQGGGRFQGASLSQSLLQAQIFLAVLAVSKMVLAAAVTERRLEQEAITRAERTQQFLVDATRILTESIDYKTTLGHVAKAAVPRFSDGCIVQILGKDGAVQTTEIASSAPETTRLLQELVSSRYLDPKGSSIFAEVIRARKPRFEVLKKTGIRSVIICPLLFRDRILGAMTFASAHPDEAYVSSDVTTVEELSRRAAIAIENSRLYLEAQEAIFSRDEFLSIASHELKTPLTSLSLQLQILNRAVKAAPPGKEEGSVTISSRVAKTALSSEEQCKKLSALLDDLLDLTRIRLGRLQLIKNTVDLGAIVSTIAEGFKAEAEQRGGSIQVEQRSITVGSWDRLRIEQIVTNLISNAIKYGEGSPISVIVEKNEKTRCAKLVVSDSGPGIPENMKEKIFERFERVPADEKNASGLGLGLYICRKIVEAHGGTIQVDSAPGRGSTFTVEIPDKDTP